MMSRSFSLLCLCRVGAVIVGAFFVLLGAFDAMAQDQSLDLRSSLDGNQPPPNPTAPPAPVGGFPEVVEERIPGARFDGAGQLDAEARSTLEAERLQRFSLSDDALITGSTDGPDGSGTGPASVRRGSDIDPYAPLGLRAGPLTWFPEIDVAVGYDSNIDGATDAVAVRTLRLSPSLRVESDWARHGLEAQVQGELFFTDDARAIERDLDADLAVRLDLPVETTLTLRGGYALTGEAVSDPDAVAGADGSTDTHDITAGFDLARQAGLIEATLSADVSRVAFDETLLAGGASQSNSDRNRLDGELTLRLERSTGPLIRPFVELSGFVRRFDQGRDRNGFDRDSFGYALRGGITLAEERPLRGSLFIGVEGERFEDDQLDDVLALTAGAGLIWDVTALTTVTLDLATDFDPTTQAGSGVGVTRSAALGLSHDLRRNVELRLGASVDDTRFSGVDADTRSYTGSAGVTWQLSRTLAFRLDTSYEHEPDSDGDTNRFVAEAGFTLRR